MSGSLFDAIFGGSVASSLLGGMGGGMVSAGDAYSALNVANDAKWQEWAANQSRNSWSTPLPKPPGIYWRRTGGKTHTVEVVR